MVSSRAFFLLVRVVLSLLGATAATVPVLILYDAASGPTAAATSLAGDDAVQLEAEQPCANAEDPATFVYDESSDLRVAGGDKAMRAYDGDLERAVGHAAGARGS